MGCFPTSPAKVEPSRRVCSLIADLLPVTLSNITDVEIASLPIKTETPRIAQTDGPNLVGAVNPDIRIVGGNGIRHATVHVDAQHGT